jgi:membrane-associated PAP2 superfamily phosphatase
MGFYFFAVAFLGRYYGSKRLLYSGLLMALGLGGSLSYARMAQGGHFLSDVLFSALIVWLTTIWTYYFMLEGKNYERAYV